MQLEPLFDRVLLRKIEAEKQVGGVHIPDQYLESNKYEVVAVGEFAVVSGLRIKLLDFVQPGDTVLVGQYNLESIEEDGEKLFLTRAQDIKGRAKRVAKSRAAA